MDARLRIALRALIVRLGIEDCRDPHFSTCRAKKYDLVELVQAARGSRDDAAKAVEEVCK